MKLQTEAIVRLSLLLPLALILASCGREQPQQVAQAPEVASEPQAAGKLDRSHAGQPAPSADFADPDGDPISIEDFRGRPVLVNLWATWCAPCVAEMPTLDALAVREEGRLHVLALSQDTAGKDKVDAFFAERSFNSLEPYLDAEMAFMLGLKLDTLPTTILYDAQGREIWRVTGAEDWTGQRATALVNEARAAASG